MPVKGDDPRNPGVRKVFSAAEVRDGDAISGYLYAVLGGERYDALAHDIQPSYVERLSFAAIATVSSGLGVCCKRMTFNLASDIYSPICLVFLNTLYNRF